jgi:transposase-like protein
MGTIATELLEAKRDERGRRITPADEREALVRAYTESGLTQKAFAKKEGVKYPTFVSWVQAQRRRRPTPKVGFAELTLPRAVAGAAPLEVQLADGTIIRGSHVEEVARLLQLIRC